MKIFRKLGVISGDGEKIEIHWIYEKDDIDMYDCGLDYKDLVNIPFSLIAADDLDYNHAQFKKLVFLFL